MTWTTEQILALAPDAGSAKAGKELAAARKWASLGRDDRAVWGECQGSGAQPYQTKIDLSGPAFHCSCPSRKFPCKHALGLFLLLEIQPALFPPGDPPGWVATWLAAREQRAEQRARKDESGAAAVADPSAQTRRAAEREAKVAAGLEALELWLRDLVRQGLAAAQGQTGTFWEAAAARLVDAQAPGLARMLREVAAIPASGEGWQERLLERIGRLYLLLEGYRRLDALPPETQADIRSRIGWSKSQEELLAELGLPDKWWVLGQRMEEEERLRVQRTWLRGEESGRPALVLQYAHPSQPLESTLVPGIALDAELVFYPGAYPLRALMKSQRRTPVMISAGAAADAEALPGGDTVAGAAAAYGAALARDPWLELFPAALQAVRPVRISDGWVVRDEAGHQLPLIPRPDPGWHLAAMSGGHPLTLFGEWDGRYLRPLSVWTEGRFWPVATDEG